MIPICNHGRVSSQEQIDGYSLDAQRRICEQFAETRGWKIVEVYQEPGRSGRSAHRPVFQRLISDAGAGLFDVILVHKLLYRNLYPFIFTGWGLSL